MKPNWRWKNSEPRKTQTVHLDCLDPDRPEVVWDPDCCDDVVEGYANCCASLVEREDCLILSVENTFYVVPEEERSAVMTSFRANQRGRGDQYLRQAVIRRVFEHAHRCVPGIDVNVPPASKLGTREYSRRIAAVITPEQL